MRRWRGSQVQPLVSQNRRTNGPLLRFMRGEARLIEEALPRLPSLRHLRADPHRRSGRDRPSFSGRTVRRYFAWEDADGYYVHCCWDFCFDLPFETAEARDESLAVLLDEDRVAS